MINFAHGGFLAIGAYLAFTLMPYIGFWGALVVAPILTAVIGLIVERVLIRRLYGRDPLYSLLLTFGLAFIIEDGTRYIWGPQTPAVHACRTGSPAAQQPTTSSSPATALFMVAAGGRGGGRACSLILSRTRLGMRIRAGTLDLETVSVLGVNVRMLRNFNFGLGIYLAGLAGVLAAGSSACSRPSATT